MAVVAAIVNNIAFASADTVSVLIVFTAAVLTVWRLRYCLGSRKARVGKTVTLPSGVTVFIPS